MAGCAFTVACVLSCADGCAERVGPDVESIKTVSATSNSPATDAAMSVRGLASFPHSNEENGEDCSDASPGKMLGDGPGWLVEGVSAGDIVEERAAGPAGAADEEAMGSLCVTGLAARSRASPSCSRSGLSSFSR